MKNALALVSLVGLSLPSALLLAESPTGIRLVDRPHIPDPLVAREFIPPAPPELKQVPPMRVDSAVRLPMESGRTLTVLRGEASTLPDLPLPKAPEAQTAPQIHAEESLQHLNYQRRHMLQIGASVFGDHVSVAHWQHPHTGEAYEAACGFDLSLLEGISRFVSNGEDYLLMLMLSKHDPAELHDFATQIFPSLREVPVGTIVYLKGNSDDPVGTAPITLLQELISYEKERLKIYQDARLRHQRAKEAWDKENPEQPRDETIWLKPHRGSRYLANPKSETNR